MENKTFQSIIYLFLFLIISSLSFFSQGVSISRVAGPIILNEVPAAAHHYIGITSMNTYTPDLLFATFGDTITINASSQHPLVQVDSSTWLSNGTTPSSSGWGTQSLSYTFVISSTDDIFYTCAIHGGMKGRINVSAQSANRGLFSDVLVMGNSVWTPYQISPHTTALNDDKNLWYKKWDRDLNLVQSQSIAIDVNLDTLYDGDLGDHMWTVLDNKFYMLTTIKGKNGAGLILYDTLFKRKSDPSYAATDTTFDKCLDMGFETDGEFLYAQYYHVPLGCNSPNCWGASIYKYDTILPLHVLDSSVVFPDSGSFVTGTSLCYVPNGQMGATQDKLQIFSTNNDYGNNQTIGIHTFAADMNLDSIGGSTKTIIEEDFDSYWPSGVSWNEQHQLWVVGYTMEYDADSIFPIEEVGKSFLKIFDQNWVLVDSFSLNNNNSDSTFRVMTESIDDDIYVVYDEMNVSGTSITSNCKIEHFKISCANSTNSINTTSCNSYTAPDLQVYTSSGQYTAIIQNSAGCDSIISINLTINNGNSGSESVNSCDDYTWLANGNSYDSSGTYTSTLTNVNGCDSTATLNLTINTVDINVTQSNVELTANASGATYQWLDCNNGFSTIIGQINQSFTAISNGSYAVEITINGCTDTSTCYIISTIGIFESIDNKLVIYPNPVFELFSISSVFPLKDATIRLINSNGQIIIEKVNQSGNYFNLNIKDKPVGIYFIEIINAENITRTKILKE